MIEWGSWSWLRWPLAFVFAAAAACAAGVLFFETAPSEGLGIAPALSAMFVAGAFVFFLITRRAIAAILFGIALPSSLALIVGLALFFTFRKHTEKYPDGPVKNIDPLTTFAEFPVYWLGRTYNGFELTQIHTQTQGPLPLHTVMYLNYGYGVCKSEGLEQHCSLTPIPLIVEPACGVLRDSYVRSADADRYVWTPEVSIRAEGTAPPAAEDLRRDLSLANASKFSEAAIVDSLTYERNFRSRC